MARRLRCVDRFSSPKRSAPHSKLHAPWMGESESRRTPEVMRKLPLWQVF
jgi:hypothetical protein